MSARAGAGRAPGRTAARERPPGRARAADGRAAPPAAVALALVAVGCATTGAKPATAGKPATASAADPGPYPSTYAPLPSQPTLIRNASIMTAAGPTLRAASILLQDGKVVAVGESVQAP